MTTNLAAAGHQVRVITPDPALAPGEQRRHTPAANLTVMTFGPQPRDDDSSVDWFELIGRLHAEQPFDLLHGYYLAAAGFVTVYAGRYLGLPTVVSARGNDLERTVFQPRQAAPILWALAHADHITAVSPDLAAKARALAPNRPVTVIHNGVDGDAFQPRPPDPELWSSLAWPADAPLIGFVGEARLKKGLAIMLPALAQVAQQVRPVPRLLLIGGVRQADKPLLNLFKAQNPALRVKVVPYLDPAALVNWYNLVDLVWLPSLRDGLPNALLEAMACGRPVIASAVGGIPAVIDDGVNGRLVAPADVGALAAATVALLGSPAQRDALGQAARRTVLDRFRPATELASNLAVYERLFSSRSAD